MAHVIAHSPSGAPADELNSWRALYDLLKSAILIRKPAQLRHQMNKERIAKLEGQVNSLLNLLIRAYAKFLFLRPMMVNDLLNQRISSQERGVCFKQLRNWLYWDFILELVKRQVNRAQRTAKNRRGLYIFFDIKVLYLKIGEERKLLEKARTIIDDLNLLVRNADAGWESFSSWRLRMFANTRRFQPSSDGSNHSAPTLS